MVDNDDRLELDHLSLPLLLTSQLEVLGPLDGALKSKIKYKSVGKIIFD